MTPTIRRAGPGDAPELARLRWEFRPEDQARQGFGEFARDFEAWLAGALASDWMAAVAEEGNGALVGCVFLRSVGKVPNPGARDRAWGYVKNAYVAPSHRAVALPPGGVSRSGGGTWGSRRPPAPGAAPGMTGRPREDRP